MNTTATPASSRYDYSIQYRLWHDDSDACAARDMAYFNEIYGRFLPGPEATVLDIGCGMGSALLALRERGFTDLAGIDVDEMQVQSCQRRGLPVNQVADATAFLRDQPERFDLILLLDVLEHVPVGEQIELMRSVYGALRPGSRVILSVPNANSPLAARWLYDDFTHHSSFTEHSLRFVLKNAGFQQLMIPGTGPPRRPSLRLWRRSVRQAFRRWLVRFLWREVLLAELGRAAQVDDMSLELNLLAVADKGPAENPQS